VSFADAWIRFHPPKIVIDPLQGSGEVMVSLMERPMGHSNLFFTIDNMQFHLCKMSFHENNWHHPQKLVISALPYLTAADGDREVKAMFQIEALRDHKLHMKKMELVVMRNSGQGVTCTAQGDPHFVNFHKMKFDFQGFGSFWLIKSHFLHIQYTTQQYVGPAYIMKAIAVQYGACVWQYNADTGNLESLPCRHGGIVVTASAAHDVVDMRFPEGSHVNLRRSIALNKWYLNVEVTLPQHAHGKVSGICGRFDNPSDTKFYDAHGRVVPTADAMGESFRVSPSECLFNCIARGFCRPLHAFPASHACSIPTFGNIAVTGDGFAHPVLPSGFRVIRPDHPRHILVPRFRQHDTPGKDITPEFRNLAHKACTETLCYKVSQRLLECEHFVEQCVLDAALSGGLHFLEGHKRSYLGRVGFISRSMQREPHIRLNHHAWNEIDLLNQHLGLGPHKCPGGCNGGLCLDGGCNCRPGWTGRQCKKSLHDWVIPEVIHVDRLLLNHPPPYQIRPPAAQGILKTIGSGDPVTIFENPAVESGIPHHEPQAPEPVVEPPGQQVQTQEANGDEVGGGEGGDVPNNNE